MAAFLLQITTPAYGAVPGDGRPIALLACGNPTSAERQAASLVATTSGRLVPLCWSVSPFYPTELADHPIFLGPLKDADGDAFAVFAVTTDSGKVVYGFIWWAPLYNPIGFKV